MILTIGMIVKNEEKWLDKCLSAIKPILDNVESELIITDTGSTDRTVEIAQKYTDKVLFFEWIKDFSAARNFGLEKAQGEWFMMLDADDIFRSCDHIIDFFNSGEYKKYNAATYISRNLFKTENGDSYSDILAPRMVRIQPDTRYENAIHESLNSFQPPYKNLQDIADHYGYYYETEEQKYNKFKRNSELLLKRFESEKDTTPMLYVQLYEAFMGIKDHEKALEYLNGGIELSKKMNSIVLAALYFHKASFYQTDKDFENAINVCEEYFKMNKIIRPYALTTDGEIYGIKAMCFYELGRYPEAVGTFKDFFETYRDIESGKIATYDSYLVSSYMCSEINIMPLFNNFIDSCIKSGKYNTADSWLSKYPLYKYSFETAKIAELVKLELDAAEHFSYKNIFEYYRKLSEYGKSVLRTSLVKELFTAHNNSYVIKALSDISKKEINDDNSAALRAAEIIIGALQLRAEKRYKECISELKKTITIYEPIAQTVSEYVSEAVEEFEKSAERTDPGEEMQRLALIVKNNVKAMISSGKHEQAKKTLYEYRQINPKDTDIEEFEAMLQGK